MSDAGHDCIFVIVSGLLVVLDRLEFHEGRFGEFEHQPVYIAAFGCHFRYIGIC